MSDADVGRWIAELADLTADEAARSRARERSLRQQAGDDTSLAEVLASLAERTALTSFTTDTGRTVTGTVLGVGRDFVAVTASRGRVTLVALARVASIGTKDPLPPTGDRANTGDGPRLQWALADLAGEDVNVSAGTGSAIGILAFVGTDVVGVRGSAGTLTYVPLSSISEVSVASGSVTRR